MGLLGRFDPLPAGGSYSPRIALQASCVRPLVIFPRYSVTTLTNEVRPM
jgi:hypothetical protein